MNMVPSSPRTPPFPLGKSVLVSLAGLLAGLHLLAGFMVSTCFLSFEQVTPEFFIHDGSDHHPAHHGTQEDTPLCNWACASFDQLAFGLPASPPNLTLNFCAVILIQLALFFRCRSLQLTPQVRGPPTLAS
ncbi:MAG: hypothetical protein NTZ28_01160 [Nitrospirae bacterium]|nr:hypothetical protein [Nitrospirota bacterium]